MIDISKKYVTKSGAEVTFLGRFSQIVNYDGKLMSAAHFPILGTFIENGLVTLASWNEKGECNINSLNCSDKYFLVKAPSLEDLKIDDKILVRQFGELDWCKRYFAGIKNGKAMTFANGCTSWSVSPIAKHDDTTESYCIIWDDWKLP